MTFQIKRCHKCGSLGVGPRAVKLLPMNGLLFCEKDWRDQLDWEEQREVVIRALRSRVEFDDAVKDVEKYEWLSGAVWLPARKDPDWLPYIADLCGLAEWGLVHQDKKIFVYYFSRALYAWELSKRSVP